MSRLQGKIGILPMIALGVILGLTTAVVMLIFAVTPPPPYYIVIDQAGANDEPGQKDLTSMGRFDDANGTPGDPSDDVLDIFWNWDDVGFSGQSGDACAQFGVP